LLKFHCHLNVSNTFVGILWQTFIWIALDQSFKTCQRKTFYRVIVINKKDPYGCAVIARKEELNKEKEKLRQSEEKYRNIFNNAQVGIFRTRISDGKVLECNDSFARIHGYETRQECKNDFVTSEHYTDPGIREKIMASLMKKGAVNDLVSFKSVYLV